MAICLQFFIIELPNVACLIRCSLLFKMNQKQIPLKSTQYKKLAPNALQFTYQNMKSCKSNEKNETKNIRLLVFSLSSINFGVFCFFMWFARFQILICELQSIWHKLLVLSWLYPKNKKECAFRKIYFSLFPLCGSNSPVRWKIGIEYSEPRSMVWNHIWRRIRTFALIRSHEVYYLQFS